MRTKNRRFTTTLLSWTLVCVGLSGVGLSGCDALNLFPPADANPVDPNPGPSPQPDIPSTAGKAIQRAILADAKAPGLAAKLKEDVYNYAGWWIATAELLESPRAPTSIDGLYKLLQDSHTVVLNNPGAYPALADEYVAQMQAAGLATDKALTAADCRKLAAVFRDMAAGALTAAKSL